jgi:hypothetical protein
MDTEYTKGFKAGLAFREEQIIKMLENDQTDCLCDDCYTNRATEVPFEVKHNEYIIALIKGEK